MAVFAIMSEVPKPELRSEIERAFPDSFYHWSDTVSFVKASGTAKVVSEKLRIMSRDGEKLFGVYDKTAVVQTSPSYWGFSKSSLWEWLKSSFEASD